jgi:hypothetical protein
MTPINRVNFRNAIGTFYFIAFAILVSPLSALSFAQQESQDDLSPAQKELRRLEKQVDAENHELESQWLPVAGRCSILKVHSRGQPMRIE